MRFFLLLLTLTVLFACGETAAPHNEATAVVPDATASEVVPPPATGTTLPAYPLDQLKYLFENCDYIDYVFFYENFSLNQAEKPAIQSSIAGISPEAALVNPACKPVGRIFFQIEGVNAAEADIYLQEGCVYYMFMENNQPAFANKMTEQLVKFYINIFTQVEQSKQGQ